VSTIYFSSVDTSDETSLITLLGLLSYNKAEIELPFGLSALVMFQKSEFDLFFLCL